MTLLKGCFVSDVNLNVDPDKITYIKNGGRDEREFTGHPRPAESWARLREFPSMTFDGEV